MLRRSLLAIALIGGTASPGSSQTVDYSRTTLGLSIGIIGGTQLWHVSGQPVLVPLHEVADTFELFREIRPGLIFSGQATHYLSPSFGLTGEFNYLGLGGRSSCNLQFDNGDASFKSLCNSLNGAVANGSVISLQFGAVARLFPRNFVQPFGKALIGFASTPTSTVSTTAVDAFSANRVTIYTDPGWSTSRPTATLSVGAATAPMQGIQARLEARMTWIAQSEVTGATAEQNREPPNKSRLFAFPSILAGLEIVLGRQRGKRY